MKKQLFVLAVMMVLGANLMAAEEGVVPVAVEAVEAVEAAAPVVSANNTVCPISGRELNLNDANDFTTLEVEGVSLNVCPMGKAAYQSNAAQYAENIAKAVAAAKAPAAVEVEAPVAEAAAPAAAY